MGAATGYICQRYSIQPLVATLGAGSIAAGIVVAWTQGEFAEQAPPFLGSLSSVTGRTFGIALPPVVAIWILAAIVIAVVLHRTAPGRRLYAAGANPLAASLALVRVRRVWITVFAASAVCSALAGVLLAGFAGANQSLGDPYLWEGLTAVVVGGTAVGGARGDYTHTAIGALILTVLSTILIGKGLSPADEQIVFGVLILIVVAGYGRERHLRDRI
jgi:ribose transport system permease protein